MRITNQSFSINQFEDPTPLSYVSYPKTGSTWLRTLIGKSLHEIYNLPEEKILDLEWLSVNAGLTKIVKTHDDGALAYGFHRKALNPLKAQYYGRKVLFLTRDFRDTLVSAYFQATKRIKVYNGSISEFIRDDRYGAKKLLTFNKYWSENKNLPAQWLCIKYEMLHHEPFDQIKQVLQFIGVKGDHSNVIEKAIQYAEFNNMRKMEESKQFTGQSGQSALTQAIEGDKQSFKTREGKFSNYRHYLNQSDLAYIDSVLPDYLCELTDYDYPGKK